jgi:hypothetical protein
MENATAVSISYKNIKKNGVRMKVNLYEHDSFGIFIDQGELIPLDEDSFEVPDELIDEYLDIENKYQDIQRKLRSIRG